MRLFFRPSPQNTLIRGILTIIIGIVFLAVPGLTLKSVIMTIGAMIMISGLFSLLLPMMWKKSGDPFYLLSREYSIFSLVYYSWSHQWR